MRVNAYAEVWLCTLIHLYCQLCATPAASWVQQSVGDFTLVTEETFHILPTFALS